MNATTTESIKVSFIDEIKQDHELFAALQSAAAELENLIEQHGLPSAQRELRWGSSHNPQLEYVALVFFEQDETGKRQSSSMTKRSWWLDPISRKHTLIRILLELREQRWRAVHKALERDIEQLELEESVAAKSD